MGEGQDAGSAAELLLRLLCPTHALYQSGIGCLLYCSLCTPESSLGRVRPGAVPDENRFGVAVVTHIWVQQRDEGGLEQLVAVEGCDHNKGGGHVEDYIRHLWSVLTCLRLAQVVPA